MMQARLNVIALVLLTHAYAFGADYYIPHNGITDHGDPNANGSIAWYFANHGAAGNRYYLTTSTTYYIGRALTIPAGTTFDTTVGRYSPIKPLTALDDGVMVYMGDNSSIYNLELNADRIARHCIVANGRHGVRIENCTLHKTKNNYTSSDPAPKPHVIYVKDASNVVIYKNLLRRAGCDPKLNADQWAGIADLIHAANNYNLTVKENNMAYALTAGVQMGQTEKAGVNDNIIQHTGLNWLYSDTYSVSDGITAYHNLSNPNGGGPYTIRSNTIRYYKNHGIHVSGHDLKIESNEIYSGDHRAIYVGDFKDPPECSSNILIRWNYVKTGNESWANEPIFLRKYEPATTSVYGNTGDNVVVYGPTCIP